MNDMHGRVVAAEDRATVEFDRTFDAPIERVWELISTPDGLSRWLAPANVDLRVGGLFDIDFGEDGLAGGEIIEVAPPAVLEYHWKFPGEPDSIIRFELEPTDAGTRLRLNHRLLPLEQAVGYGAGWHAHLDQLDHALTSGAEFDWMKRFNELLPTYAIAD